MMKRFLLLSLLTLVTACTCAVAQEPAAEGGVTVAIFPFKNLYGFVQHDTLSWEYADSLHAWLSAQPGAGTDFQLVSMDDIRDQMLAMNVDVKSPSYETDVWNLARALGANKVIWGTYLVKYEKSNIEAKIIDVKTIMPDPVNVAKKIRAPFAESLSTVPEVGGKLIGGLK